MAEETETILNRINRWFGGITVSEKDTTPGVHLNMEEVDIFESKDYVRPTTIFGSESVSSPITSLTSSGTTATATTTSNHGLTTGGSVTISGANVAAYNGTFTVTVTNNTVFTYVMLSDPADTTTGTIVATYTALRKVTGYTLDENDNLFVLSKDTTATPLAQIWKRTTASATSPSALTHYKTSANNSNAQSPLAWHQYFIDITSITRTSTTATVTTTANHGLTNNDTVVIVGANQNEYNGTYTITVTGVNTFTYTVSGTPATPATGTIQAGISYLYLVTGTNGLMRLGTVPSSTNESLTDLAGTTMALPGLGYSNDRIVFIRHGGELHVLNGQYVSTIDETGVFVQKAFTLPDGWSGISADIVGSYMAILARNINNGMNSSRLFWWDLTATTGVLDEVKIPSGGPQIIVNYQEIPLIFCAQNGVLYIYALINKYPQLIKKLYNIKTETTTQAIIPSASKFTFKDTIFFGLWKTDKTGLYQLGRFDVESGFALLLGKRFSTSSYSAQIPYAAIGAGPNMYVSFDENGTSAIARMLGDNSPTFSSNAIIETIQIDAGKQEMNKEWASFVAVSKPLAANCTITIDARVDNATSYDTNATSALTSSNDQIHDGGTADTYWKRDWTSVLGRVLQTKISFTSNGSTARPTLVSLGILSRDLNLYG